MRKLYVGIGIGPGMGLSTAERFAREGYDVVITARNKSKIEQLAEKLSRDTGGKVGAMALDAGDLSAIQEFAEAHGESTTVLHYNAASMHNTSIFDASVESLDHDITVDITGALVAIKAFTAIMKKNKRDTVLLTGGGFALSPSLGVPDSKYRQGRHPLHGGSPFPGAGKIRYSHRDRNGRKSC